MQRSNLLTLTCGLALGLSTAVSCTSLTTVDWSRIPPPQAAAGNDGMSDTPVGGAAPNDSNDAPTSGTAAGGTAPNDNNDSPVAGATTAAGGNPASGGGAGGSSAGAGGS